MSIRLYLACDRCGATSAHHRYEQRPKHTNLRQLRRAVSDAEGWCQAQLTGYRRIDLCRGCSTAPGGGPEPYLRSTTPMGGEAR